MFATRLSACAAISTPSVTRLNMSNSTNASKKKLEEEDIYNVL
jgi:hypothetical protein